MEEFELQYRSMNVDHLEDDEIEHELHIRSLTFGRDDSRDSKKRKLRRALKDQSIQIVLFKEAEQCDTEANLIDWKLALIRERLENQKPKKVELPALKTRLIHLYFRALRLKDNFDTNGLENAALKMLNEQFSMFSSDPNASRRAVEETRKALKKLKKKSDKVFSGSSDSVGDSDEEDSDEDESGEDDSGEDEEESNEDTLRAKRNTSTPKAKNIKRKREGISGKTVKMLMKHMESMLEKK